MEEAIWIILIVMVFAVALPVIFITSTLVKIVHARHEERMLMIEKGVTLQEKKRSAPNKLSSLRTGMVMIGLAIGAISGMVIESQLPYTWESSFLILFLTILGGGISFVFYFFIARKIQIGENE